MKNNIEDRIKNVMSIVFNVPVSVIDENASPDSIESWDSLKHMNLIIALEEEFNIKIPDVEVANILTYKLILYIINEILTSRI